MPSPGSRIQGQLLGASFENSAADLSPASLGLVYFNTVSGEVKWYTGSSFATAADLSTVQTFVNKTLTAPKIDQALLIEGAAPSTPASGYASLYAKADHKLYLKDSTGVETAVGAGSGGGSVNYIENPNDAGGWASSGGGISVATTSTLANLPLGPIVDTAIRVTRSSGANYAYYRFTMPATGKNRKLQVSLDMLPDSGYASGDVELSLHTNTASNYGGTYAQLVLASDVSGVTGLPNASGTFVTAIDSDSSSYYELRLKGVAGTTPLNVAAVSVGPGVTAQGAAVYAGDSYQATVTGLGSGSTVASTVIWERVGDSLHMTGRVQKDGTAGTGSAYVKVSLPPGLHINTARITSVNLGEHNFGSFDDFQNSRIGYVSLENDGVFNSVLFVKTVTSAPLPGSDVGATFLFNFNAIVPIAEWAGSGALNIGTNDVVYVAPGGTWDADISVGSEVYGPQGFVTGGGALTAARSKSFAVPSVVQITDKATLWLRFNGMWTKADQFASSYCTQNGTEYGYQLYPTGTANQWNLYLGQYRYPSGATFGAAGASWSGVEAIRVSFEKAGVAVGFGKATSNTAGLVTLPTSEVRAEGANGYGSTNTVIRRFTTVTSSGGAITFTDDAALGGKFTINKPGKYSISYTDQLQSASLAFGISKNSNQLTTDILSITAAHRLGSHHTAAASYSGNVAAVVECVAGDVLRAHVDTGATVGNNPALVMMIVSQVCEY